MRECYRGHPQRGPADTLPSGHCRHCARINEKRYDKRRKLAMAMLHAAEARGLSGGEALALLQHADYATLQDCQTEARRAPAE